VDNSPNVNTYIKEYFDNDKTKYLPLRENMGIAHALNKGIDFAKEKRARWLLTMDQDSSFSSDEFAEYKAYINQLSKSLNSSAIFTPIHGVEYLSGKGDFEVVETAMTSGNMIDINKIDEIGYFNERLFIDSVDHEYCYRVKNSGYRVYRLNNV
ncbi:glycosyltransferase, partial [Terribacillus saccharophilus]|uniref:glycosyltransferase n=1 Tax=Terribacillus saccharophilus TaxID=361277 RepID=UPI000BCA60DF